MGTVRALQTRMAHTEDPHAELMALVWGPRFDRTHAVDWLLQKHPPDPALLLRVSAAADQFDTLAPPRQRRLRQMIALHKRSFSAGSAAG